MNINERKKIQLLNSPDNFTSAKAGVKITSLKANQTVPVGPLEEMFTYKVSYVWKTI